MSPYKMSKIEESIRIALKFIDCINDKDIVSISELIGTECVFSDIWESTSDCITRKSIIDYFSMVFARYPNIRLEITEANNLVHKCIVKYKCFGLSNNEETYTKCIGIFEVRNIFITRIDLYSKSNAL